MQTDLLSDVSKEKTYIVGKKAVRNLKDLHAAVQSLDETSFSHYVNEHKHEFYSWVRSNFHHKAFAAELVDCHSQSSVVKTLDRWIKEAERLKKEREVVEAVVKAKVKELMQRPIEQDNFRSAKLMDPLTLNKVKESKKVQKIPFTGVSKQISQDAHPKNIRNEVAVPKLWELKPLKKVEKKLEWKTELNKVKQVKLTEIKVERRIQQTVFHFPQHTSPISPIQPPANPIINPTKTMIRSRKVNADSQELIIEKLKEVYKSEI